MKKVLSFIMFLVLFVSLTGCINADRPTIEEDGFRIRAISNLYFDNDINAISLRVRFENTTTEVQEVDASNFSVVVGSLNASTSDIRIVTGNRLTTTSSEIRLTLTVDPGTTVEIYMRVRNAGNDILSYNPNTVTALIRYNGTAIFTRS